MIGDKNPETYTEKDKETLMTLTNKEWSELFLKYEPASRLALCRILRQRALRLGMTGFFRVARFEDWVNSQ